MRDGAAPRRDPGLSPGPDPHVATFPADNATELAHRGLDRHGAPRDHRAHADHRGRATRRRVGRDPARAVPRPRGRRPRRCRDGPREPSLLRALRRTRRAGARRSTGTDVGLLPQVRVGVLIRASAPRRRARRRPVRGGRLPGPRRHGLGLSGARPQRVGSLGSAQGPPQRRRRRRDGGRAGRAPLPGRGRASEHRQDLQLRPARELRLHRHGVRRRPESQADPRRAAGGQRRGGRPAPAGPGDRLHARDPPGARLPARARPAVLRLQDRQRHPDPALAEADRPGRGVPDGRPHLGGVRHGRLPGARNRQRRAVDRVGPVHGGPDACRPVLRLPRLPEHLPVHVAAAGVGAAARALRLAVPLPARGNRHQPRRPLPVSRGDGRPALRSPA